MGREASFRAPQRLRLGRIEGAEKDSDESLRWLQSGHRADILLTDELKKLGCQLRGNRPGRLGRRRLLSFRSTRYAIYYTSYLSAGRRTHPDLLEVFVEAVGAITAPQQADDVLAEGNADIVLLAREYLRWSTVCPTGRQ